MDERRMPLVLAWARPALAGGAPALASRVLSTVGMALLSDPTEESLRMLSDSAAPPLPEAFAEALEAVARSAREAEVLAARVEYTRLFHSPRGAPCPPWECVSRDQVPHLMGPRHFEVLAYFRRAGVEPRSAGSESADHVGTELAFLSLLAGRMEEGEDHSELFSEFWAEHVATWMPAFAKGLIANARLPLYLAAGVLLLRAVEGPVEPGP